MDFRPVGDELFHADGQADRHYEANSHFRNFANEPKCYPLGHEFGWK